MAYNGVIIESAIRATNVDALNKSCVSEVDVAGGGFITLAPSTKAGDDRWTATNSTDGKGVYIAYNPSEHLTEVNGKVFAGLSADPRDYVNLKGRTFTAFKPCVGDEIVVTADAITGSPNVGEFVEAGTDGKGVPSATASAGKTSFKVAYKKNIPFPAGGIGNEQVTAYALVCVQE